MSVKRRLHKQKRKNTCMVAALRTVLDLQVGVKVAEQALEALGTTATDPILKSGCGTRELRLMVKGVSRMHNLQHTRKPWTVRTSQSGSVPALIGELAAGRIPIASITNGTEGYHAIVILAIESGRIKIWDPQEDEPEWLSEDYFLSLWQEEGLQWYAVLGGT